MSKLDEMSLLEFANKYDELEIDEREWITSLVEEM